MNNDGFISPNGKFYKVNKPTFIDGEYIEDSHEDLAKRICNELGLIVSSDVIEKKRGYKRTIMDNYGYIYYAHHTVDEVPYIESFNNKATKDQVNILLQIIQREGFSIKRVPTFLALIDEDEYDNQIVRTSEFINKWNNMEGYKDEESICKRIK